VMSHGIPVAETDEVSVETEDPIVDQTLSNVADKIASQILTATAEDRVRREENPEGLADEEDSKPEDTKVMEGLSDRVLRETERDNDEAIERALYSLLGDDSRMHEH